MPEIEGLGDSHIFYQIDGAKETTPYDSGVGYLITSSPLNRREAVGFGLPYKTQCEKACTASRIESSSILRWAIACCTANFSMGGLNLGDAFTISGGICLVRIRLEDPDRIKDRAFSVRFSLSL